MRIFSPLLRLSMLYRLILATLAALALSPPAAAQPSAFPDKTIRVVVPFAAGGGIDVMARLYAEKAKGALGVPVIVENRPGASATIGGLAVHQSAPDGYTLLFVPVTHSMANGVMKSVPYDAVADFTPVARVGTTPLLVVMSSKMPQSTLAEVAAAARARPADWTIATSGLGSAGHITSIEFRNIARADISITPYRGTAPALTDVLGGHVQLLIDSIITLLPPAREGKVKALAVTSAKRSPLAPEVPTAAESGMPSLEFISWFGFLGPKGMPAEVVTKLNATFNEAGRSLAAENKLASLGTEPVAETPEAFARFIRAQVERNAKLLQDAGFKPE
jgi:tripartite-type tricarboxylate transporter receptor subunit TctC